jgi:2-polyprenyl-6-methoxyphenol hydroxylase-like FAD-dependent oxidoreductase
MDTARADVHVAIVGAGPSGLILAAALCRRGMKATIFEREVDPARLVVGAGVNLMQPVISVLEQEGLMEEVAKCNKPASHFSFHDAVTNNVVRKVDLHARYGQPYYTVRRGDLVAALLRSLCDHQDIVWRYGMDVIGVKDADFLSGGILNKDFGSRSRLCFRDGSTSEELFDVVVGANGIDSSLREHVQHGTLIAQKESIACNIIGVASAEGLSASSPAIAQALQDRPDFTVYLDPSMTLLLARVTPKHIMWGVALNAKDFPPNDPNGYIDEDSARFNCGRKLSEHLGVCSPSPSPFVASVVTACLAHTPTAPDPDAPYLWRLRDIDPVHNIILAIRVRILLSCSLCISIVENCDPDTHGNRIKSVFTSGLSY